MHVSTKTLQQNLYEFWRRSGVNLFTAAVVLCTALVITNRAAGLYIVSGVDDAAIVLSGEGTAPELESRLIYTSNGSRGYDVCLRLGQTVTVRHDGEVFTTKSRQESILRTLRRLDIVPGPLEMVGIDFTESGVEITVSSDLSYYEHVVEEVAFETVRVANPRMEEGKEKVVQEGADGVRSSVYEVVWSNGREVARQFVEELSSTAVDKIVEYGTAAPAKPAAAAFPSNDSPIVNISTNADGSGVLTLASGEKLSFSSVKNMTATAYTAGHGGADHYTATGTTVRVGTVAVDKKVIPLGTRMYIVTNDGIVYGTAVAEDTGVRGSKVDLYFNTYDECINFGRRSCKVYILK
nr:G5 domain-containing protein [uncultured Oscillibacter sp.]